MFWSPPPSEYRSDCSLLKCQVGHYDSAAVSHMLMQVDRLGLTNAVASGVGLQRRTKAPSCGICKLLKRYLFAIGMEPFTTSVHLSIWTFFSSVKCGLCSAGGRPFLQWRHLIQVTDTLIDDNFYNVQIICENYICYIVGKPLQLFSLQWS